MIEVIPVGAEVTIGKAIKAHVASVAIMRGDAVKYECVWWDGNTRKCEYLHAREVEPTTKETTQIGFQQIPHTAKPTPPKPRLVAEGRQ